MIQLTSAKIIYRIITIYIYYIMFIRLSHKASHTHFTNNFSLSIYVDHIQGAWLAI